MPVYAGCCCCVLSRTDRSQLEASRQHSAALQQKVDELVEMVSPWNMDYPPHKWPERPRICTNGPTHLATPTAPP